LRISNEKSTPIQDLYVRPAMLCDLLQLIDSGKISGKMAKEILDDMVTQKKSAQELISEKGLEQLSDPEAIRAMIQDVLAKNASQVADYRAGKEKLLGYLVGQVMKATQGKANPGMLNQILLEELKRGV